MVNELRQLLHDNVADAPTDVFDVAEVVRRGKGRTRRRTAGVAGAAALAVAAVAAFGAVLPGPDGSTPGPATRSTAPVGPVAHLEDAEDATPGEDYQLLGSHTNQNLDRANGEYFDGVTPDGLVVVRDGPSGPDNLTRFALMDPTTGEKDWLPEAPVTVEWALELGQDQLVFLAGMTRLTDPPSVLVFDRTARSWSRLDWPTLPEREWRDVLVGPDNRLYVGFSTGISTGDSAGESSDGSEGELSHDVPPASGEEVDDAGAPGERYDLWSASLIDPADVRDEKLRVGSVAFTGSTLVWTETTNGTNARVFVRDYTSGMESSFDPRSGDNCNLLGLGVSGEHIAMSQYCGTEDGVRDDRVQVVTLTGEPVVTIQDDDLDGHLAGGALVMLDAYGATEGGAYAYELDTGRFLRLSDSVSRFAMGGTVPVGYLLWDEPVNSGHGAVQKLARLR